MKIIRLLLPVLLSLSQASPAQAQNLLANSVTVNGSGGTGFVQIANQASAPSTPTNSSRIYFDSSNRLSWKGTNGFIRTFDGTANTADRVYVLPDASSTVALTGLAQSFSATQTFSSGFIVTGSTNAWATGTSSVSANATSAGSSRVRFVNAGAASDMKAYQIVAGSNNFALQTVKEDLTTTNTFLSASRTADGISSTSLSTLSGASMQTSLTVAGGNAATWTGGAGNLTIISGTGNSRTMTLQSTTSGGTATTGLSISATQVVAMPGGVASTTSTTGTAVITGGLGVSGAMNLGTYISAGSNALLTGTGDIAGSGWSQTGAPTGGSAAKHKIGAAVTGLTLSLLTTTGIEYEAADGTKYYLLVATRP